MDTPGRASCWWQNQQSNVLIVVAAIAALGLVWLGMEAQVVRHRRAMIEKIEAADGGFDGTYTFTEGVARLIVLARPAVIPHPHDGTRRAPSPIRRMLGDRTIGNVYFFRPLTDEDREAIKALPEADVWALQDLPSAP